MAIGGIAFVRVKENELMKGLSKISYEVYLSQSLAIGISQLLFVEKGLPFCVFVIGADIVVASVLTFVNNRIMWTLLKVKKEKNRLCND